MHTGSRISFLLKIIHYCGHFEKESKNTRETLSLRVHPAINTGEIYGRNRANGEKDKIRLLEEMPCSQSTAF
jgi:hypothetical protein